MATGRSADGDRDMGVVSDGLEKGSAARPCSMRPTISSIWVRASARQHAR